MTAVGRFFPGYIIHMLKLPFLYSFFLSHLARLFLVIRETNSILHIKMSVGSLFMRPGPHSSRTGLREAKHHQNLQALGVYCVCVRACVPVNFRVLLNEPSHAFE